MAKLVIDEPVKKKPILVLDEPSSSSVEKQEAMDSFDRDFQLVKNPPPEMNLSPEEASKRAGAIFDTSINYGVPLNIAAMIHDGENPRPMLPSINELLNDPENIGFWRRMKTEWLSPEIVNKTPIMGGLFGAKEGVDYLAAKDRLRLDEYGRPDEYGIVEFVNTAETDRAVIKDFEDKQAELQKLTLGGKVARAGSQLPTFMAEIWMTGGLSAVVKTGIKTGVKKAIGDAAEKGILKATTGTVAWLAGNAARTAPGWPRVAEAIIQRRTDIEQGIRSSETWATSAVMGWSDQFIQYATEETGGVITKGLKIPGGLMVKGIGKLPFGSKMMGAIEKAWTSLKPGNTVAQFYKNIANRTRWNGMIGELGEERLVTIFQGIVGAETFGTGPDASPIDRVIAGIYQDLEVSNIAAELLTLSIPGAIGLTYSAYDNVKSTLKKEGVPDAIADKMVEAYCLLNYEQKQFLV